MSETLTPSMQAGFEVDDAMEVLCHALDLEGLQKLADLLSREDASPDELKTVIQVCLPWHHHV